MVHNEKMIYRSSIWLVNLGTSGSHIMSGVRPCLVVQNNNGNLHSPLIIVVPLTSKYKKFLPTHVYLTPHGAPFSGLTRPSCVLCEQILTVPREAFVSYVGCVELETMSMIERAISNSLALDHPSL